MAACSATDLIGLPRSGGALFYLEEVEYLLFASDLDRTLIYSEKFLNGKPEDYLLADRHNGRDISFMTRRSGELLKEISEAVTFIPVTTRTEEEYKRILPVVALQPKYAIVANGGKVLIDGKEDPVWKNFVAYTLSRMPFTLEEAHTAFFTYISHDLFDREKLSDNLFWMLRLLTEGEGAAIVQKTKEPLRQMGFEVLMTGRKIYLVPESLTKWKALSYVIEKETTEFFISAGDSLMDLEMLSRSHIGITPRHGEILAENVVPNSTVVTQKSGVNAGEEILEQVKSVIIKKTTLKQSS